MSEESSKEEEDENDDDIPRQLSLNSSSPSEEIFLFHTRGRTRIAKKKSRLEISKTKGSCAAKFSNVATKIKSVSRGGKSSVPPKKSFPGSRYQRPRSRSLASGTLSTPPRLNSNVHGGPSTVPRTEPNKRILPGHTPTRHGGQVHHHHHHKTNRKINLNDLMVRNLNMTPLIVSSQSSRC